MDGFRGRVAVVTGAASGIGLALCEELAAAGASVVMADVDAARLATEADRLRAGDAAVLDVATDVTDAGAVEALATRTQEAFGRVDLLCNNAGTIAFGPVWEIPVADWERVIRVNLLAAVHGLRAFVPLMRASGDDGHVVNTASMAAFLQLGVVGPYVATKHAMVGLSIALAEDLEEAGSGIGVSVVCPGMVATPFVGHDPGSTAPLAEGTISATDAARTILEAVLAGRFYVFTHPESAADVDDRYRRVRTTFDT